MIKTPLEYRIIEWLDQFAPGVQYECLGSLPRLAYFTSESGFKCAECGSGRVERQRVYTPDLYFPSTGVYIEAKGMFSANRRRLLRDFSKARPDIDLRYIFQANNKLSRKSKNRYLDWAEQVGRPAVLWTAKNIQKDQPPMPSDWYEVKTGEL